MPRGNAASSSERLCSIDILDNAAENAGTVAHADNDNAALQAITPLNAKRRIE
ncbi:MAG: hypothetical protein G5702_04055, partial [Serratia symbiotica]|nr:hypothetical protein [Serratia symbiotica]